MMSTHSVEANVAATREVAEGAYRDAAQIVGLIEILEASNTGGIDAALNKAGAGGAVLQIQFSLIWRLQLLVARAYSKPTKEGDLHLRRGFELLGENSVRQRVVTGDRAKHLHDAESRWKKCCGDTRLSKIEHARHKFIAHLGRPNAKIEVPKYRELFDFARETAAIMEHLALAAGFTMNGGLSAERETFAESAKIFWAPWTTQ
jgi:hypothetical protein